MTEPTLHPVTGDSRRDARKLLARQRVRPLSAVTRFVLAFMAAGLIAWLAGGTGLGAAPVRMLFILVLAAQLWLFEIIPAYAVGILVIALQILLLGNPEGGVFAEEPDDWETFVVVLGHPLIWLFFGGFVLSAAVARTGLDLSMARRLISWSGDSPGSLLFGIMGGALVFSMFMSNTATTAMMLAITVPVVASLSAGNPFRKALLLGVPFAANMGGMATLIGSPPNAIAAGALASLPDQDVGFLTWMVYGLPPALVLFALTWAYLKFRYPMLPEEGLRLTTTIQSTPEAEEPAPRWQRSVVIVTLAVTVGFWMTGQWTGLPSAAVSLLPITVLTVTGILRDRDVRRLPWDILLLLAGGLALGNGVRDTGLADWLVALLPFSELSELSVVLLLCYTTILVSNLMSNTAAANILVPIAVVMASGFEGLAVVPLALCASCAMCLPISTPPNAIAFATGELAAGDFLRGGLLIGAVAPLVTLGWLLLVIGY